MPDELIELTIDYQFNLVTGWGGCTLEDTEFCTFLELAMWHQKMVDRNKEHQKDLENLGI